MISTLAQRLSGLGSVALLALAGSPMAANEPASSVEIRYFRSDVAAVNPGGSALLTWDTRYATQCEIAPEVGTVPVPSGERLVNPTGATKYTLACKGPGTPVSASVDVAVRPPPRVLGVTASPGAIALGGTSRVSWSAQDATSCLFKPGDETVPSSGQKDVSPEATTTYAVACSGVGPVSMRTASVSVGALALNSFAADPRPPWGRCRCRAAGRW
jgi:hypothetical protein